MQRPDRVVRKASVVGPQMLDAAVGLDPEGAVLVAADPQPAAFVPQQAGQQLARQYRRQPAVVDAAAAHLGQAAARGDPDLVVLHQQRGDLGMGQAGQSTGAAAGVQAPESLVGPDPPATPARGLDGAHGRGADGGNRAPSAGGEIAHRQARVGPDQHVALAAQDAADAAPGPLRDRFRIPPVAADGRRQRACAVRAAGGTAYPQHPGAVQMERGDRAGDGLVQLHPQRRFGPVQGRLQNGAVGVAQQPALPRLQQQRRQRRRAGSQPTRSPAMDDAAQRIDLVQPVRGGRQQEAAFDRLHRHACGTAWHLYGHRLQAVRADAPEPALRIQGKRGPLVGHFHCHHGRSGAQAPHRVESRVDPLDTRDRAEPTASRRVQQDRAHRRIGQTLVRAQAM